MALYDDLDRSGLHTVTKSRQRILKVSVNDYNNVEVCSDLSLEVPQNSDEEMDQNNEQVEVTSIEDRMRCSNTGRILLAVAWTTKSLSRFFKMFPEVSSWDVTEKTNTEKRKLFIGLNYDSSGTSNPHTHVFLPSGRRWVFNWGARHAIPILHGSIICKEIKLHLFDEDLNEIIPFENATEVFPNSKIRICWFHRAILKTASFGKFATDTEDDKAESIINGFNILCDSISEDVETIQEYVLTRNLIRIWLNQSYSSGYISKSLSDALG